MTGGWQHQRCLRFCCWPVANDTVCLGLAAGVVDRGISLSASSLGWHFYCRNLFFGPGSASEIGAKSKGALLVRNGRDCRPLWPGADFYVGVAAPRPLPHGKGSCATGCPHTIEGESPAAGFWRRLPTRPRLGGPWPTLWWRPRRRFALLMVCPASRIRRRIDPEDRGCLSANNPPPVISPKSPFHVVIW